VFAIVIDLEFHLGGEISEGKINHVGHQNEVDGLIQVLLHAEGQPQLGHGEFLVGHPGGDFLDFAHVGADVPRAGNHRPKAFQYGASDRFRPAKGRRALDRRNSVCSGGREYRYSSQALQKAAAARVAHQR